MTTYTPFENLSPEEQALELALEKEYQEKESIKKPEKKQILLRLLATDLLKLKAKAEAIGIPYQTYLTYELHKLANKED